MQIKQGGRAAHSLQSCSGIHQIACISPGGKRAERASFLSVRALDMEITRSPGYIAGPLKGDISVLPLEKSSLRAEARINTILV